MKSFIIFAFVLLTIMSCGTHKTNPQASSVSIPVIFQLDKNSIDKIELLIADSSLIDPVHKELPTLARIGKGLSFLDSAGILTLKPTQRISFTQSEKNKLVDIFNNYLTIPQDTTLATACSILYRHVFVLQDSVGKNQEQIYLCLDCTNLDFIKNNAHVKFLDQSEALFRQLIMILRNGGAYVPSYGPAASVRE
jgi:hypothetical protein